jgi:hypothetical protein
MKLALMYCNSTGVEVLIQTFESAVWAEHMLTQFTAALQTGERAYLIEVG